MGPQAFGGDRVRGAPTFRRKAEEKNVRGFRMKLALCTICLNEDEFLEANYRQHHEWPGMVAWYFVHGACRQYADANPAMVDGNGLSVDRTRSILQSIGESDSRVRWMDVTPPATHTNPAMEKATLRNWYLNAIRRWTPEIDWFVVLDADEFYAKTHQAMLASLMATLEGRRSHLTANDYHAIQTHRCELWRPPSIADQPRAELEVRGGYWAVPHTRFFRWGPSLLYDLNHNVPNVTGMLPWNRNFVWNSEVQVVHLGFTRASATREATNRFYVHRGEGARDGRQWYVDCRSAWETWQPGDVLPHGAYVLPVADPRIGEMLDAINLA